MRPLKGRECGAGGPCRATIILKVVPQIVLAAFVGLFANAVKLAGSGDNPILQILPRQVIKRILNPCLLSKGGGSGIL